MQIGELRFLYIGTDDTERDLAFYRDVLGAELRWRFRHFEADVAAISLGESPLIMLADHRRAPSVLPIYAVDNLAAAMQSVVDAGGKITEGPVGTPEGDVFIVEDRSGNQIAFIQVERPGAMDGAYADAANTHAVRED